MSFSPKISVILSTYQRPEHLRRSLLSLAWQRGVAGQFEVVVTDDGSADHTAEIVARFERRVDFPVKFTTQAHEGFRLARCRNEGVRASSAPYVLFSDGDCIFPHDHLRQHLRARRPGVALSGDCFRLDERSTQRVNDAVIASGIYRTWVPLSERWRLFRRRIKDWYYEAVGHQTKPKLTGCNMAVWRADLERINGFDECFVGWGCEDDDLAQRLRRSGIRIASIVGRTQAYHLWHAADPSQPAKWSDGANVAYLMRRDKPIRCLHGLSAEQPVDSVPPRDASADEHAPASQRSAA